MKNYRITCTLIASIVAFLGYANSASAQLKYPVALSKTQIGYIGTAEMVFLAPPRLEAATREMGFTVQKYDSALAAFKRDLQSNPGSKFSYIALCQLDARFRDAEYLKWQGNEDETADVLFHKGVSLYFHTLCYYVHNPDLRTQPRHAKDSYLLLDKEKGPLAIFSKLWKREPDLLNGILLSAIQTDIMRKPDESDFLAKLIRVAAGEEPAKRYLSAKEKNWDVLPPDSKNLSRKQIANLIAALSNEIRRQGTGAGGAKNTLVDYNGEVKAIYSEQEEQWLFVQKGTELHYIGEWRRALKRMLASMSGA